MSVYDKHSAANTANNENMRNRGKYGGKVGLSKDAKPLMQPPSGIKTVKCNREIAALQRNHIVNLTLLPSTKLNTLPTHHKTWSYCIWH